MNSSARGLCGRPGLRFGARAGKFAPAGVAAMKSDPTLLGIPRVDRPSLAAYIARRWASETTGMSIELIAQLAGWLCPGSVIHGSLDRLRAVYDRSRGEGTGQGGDHGLDSPSGRWIGAGADLEDAILVRPALIVVGVAIGH